MAGVIVKGVGGFVRYGTATQAIMKVESASPECYRGISLTGQPVSALPSQCHTATLADMLLWEQYFPARRKQGVL